ncbi:hypothetical protein JKA74_06030 [Marivirga sp. S37H4]|uniref:Uncharacterized protein n=1 Tax=Marivirga aurantiaca TaxID=2802615 RepID=A0A934WX82_9BACT|nr:hypothetical protein [Marivirga aurantiaca]
METKRACIYPKDVQRITGMSERYGRKLLNKIREELSKEPHQFISIDEFCEFTGLAPAIVERYITD